MRGQPDANFEPLLRVDDLRLSFPAPSGKVGDETEVVSGLSFSLFAGQSLGLIGESGCGKSLTAKTLLGLAPKTAEVTGHLALKGQASNLRDLDDSTMAKLRGQRLAMIFQEPMSALNPVQTVGAQVEEVLRLKTSLGRKQRRERLAVLWQQVQLDLDRAGPSAYPHRLSGGQRQRVLIAMALASNPDILLADEPTTALDVSTQADILDLLERLIIQENKALLLITHDLAVVARSCDQVLVMYAGALVETGPIERILSRPQHPYTLALLKSMPTSEQAFAPGKRLYSIPGQVPEPRQRPPGCSFAPRCPLATDMCRQFEPELSVASFSGSVACFNKDRVQSL